MPRSTSPGDDFASKQVFSGSKAVRRPGLPAAGSQTSASVEARGASLRAVKSARKWTASERGSSASSEATTLLLPSRAVTRSHGATVLQNVLSLGSPDPPLLLVLPVLPDEERRRASRDRRPRVLSGCRERTGAGRHRQGQRPSRAPEVTAGVPHRLAARHPAPRQDAAEERDAALREGRLAVALGAGDGELASGEKAAAGPGGGGVGGCPPPPPPRLVFFGVGPPPRGGGGKGKGFRK